ncbi:hypothetical protein KGQ20_30500 [Catenulispora sp. NF23]|uniref:hypothetical protein n=1 Tax=Catenulispora pinistramenti TaxID=2705254 RepID=UPI001BABBDF7|nr:hypothetical protein [Catenulispora pinistramenti]MBS2537096.1 hypothetical protein [Catenulispora pinistramenti]
MAEGDRYDICDSVWALLNVGDDPQAGTPDPRAVNYRRRGHRSLSVGDVAAVGDFGFTRIPDRPEILCDDQVSGP